jgi:hypothetical protein
MKQLTLPLFLLLVGVSSLAARTIEVSTTGNIRNLGQAAAVAEPGDTILFRGGVYAGGDYVAGLQGTAAAWITILAAPGEDVTLRGGGNAWQLADAAYLRIAGFVIEGQTGNGLNLDDGGSMDTPAHHLVIERCRFRALDATGNNDQLKMSGIDSFEVRDCVFQDGSPGGSQIDMVGCHYGRFADNIFERMGSNAIQNKGGTRYITIERNRFDSGAQFSRAINIGGSTGLQFFRPANANYEAADILVQSNVFIGTDAPIAFVGAVNCLVVNNTIWLPNRWPIRILQETTEASFLQCGDNAFVNNIVVVDSRAANPAINIGPNTRPESFLFANNLWYNLASASWSGPNVPVAEPGRILNRDPQLTNPPSDMTPRPGSPAIAAGAPRAPGLDYRLREFLTPPTIGAIEAGTTSSVALDADRELRVRMSSTEIRVDGAKRLVLSDATGRIVASGDDVLSTEQIATGAYFLVIEVERSRIVRPVIVP